MAENKEVFVNHSQWNVELLASLSQLQISGMLCDTTLECSDDIAVRAHSCILAAASRRVKHLLRGAALGYYTLHMREVKSSTWQHILRFIYDGKVSVERDEIDSLYDAAQRFQINRLTEALCNSGALIRHQVSRSLAVSGQCDDVIEICDDENDCVPSSNQVMHARKSSSSGKDAQDHNDDTLLNAPEGSLTQASADITQAEVPGLNDNVFDRFNLLQFDKPPNALPPTSFTQVKTPVLDSISGNAVVLINDDEEGDLQVDVTHQHQDIAALAFAATPVSSCPQSQPPVDHQMTIVIAPENGHVGRMSLDHVTSVNTGKMTPSSATPVNTGKMTPSSTTPVNTGKMTPSSATSVNTGKMAPSSATPVNTGKMAPSSATPVNNGKMTPSSATPVNTGKMAPSSATPVNNGKMTPSSATSVNTGKMAPSSATVARGVTPATLVSAPNKALQPAPTGSIGSRTSTEVMNNSSTVPWLEKDPPIDAFHERFKSSVPLVSSPSQLSVASSPLISAASSIPAPLFCMQAPDQHKSRTENNAVPDQQGCITSRSRGGRVRGRGRGVGRGHQGPSSTGLTLPPEPCSVVDFNHFVGQEGNMQTVETASRGVARGRNRRPGRSRGTRGGSMVSQMPGNEVSSLTNNQSSSNPGDTLDPRHDSRSFSASYMTSSSPQISNISRNLSIGNMQAVASDRAFSDRLAAPVQSLTPTRLSQEPASIQQHESSSSSKDPRPLTSAPSVLVSSLRSCTLAVTQPCLPPTALASRPGSLHRRPIPVIGQIMQVDPRQESSSLPTTARQMTSAGDEKRKRNVNAELTPTRVETGSFDSPKGSHENLYGACCSVETTRVSMNTADQQRPPGLKRFPVSGGHPVNSALQGLRTQEVASLDRANGDIKDGPRKKRKVTPKGNERLKTDVKFTGRRIRHEWIVQSNTGLRKWYEGTVLKLLSGVDGGLQSRYLIKYDKEDEAYEIDHLVEDYLEGSVIIL